MRILTNFVKNKIKGLSFNNVDDRNYIKDLMYIENKIVTPCANWGYAGAMCFHWKQRDYPDEYKEIYKELDPEGFKKVLKNRIQDEKKRKRSDKKFWKQQDKETQAFKKEWIKAGGK